MLSATKHLSSKYWDGKRFGWEEKCSELKTDLLWDFGYRTITSIRDQAEKLGG
jgi:hypothetical protein